MTARLVTRREDKEPAFKFIGHIRITFHGRHHQPAEATYCAISEGARIFHLATNQLFPRGSVPTPCMFSATSSFVSSHEKSANNNPKFDPRTAQVFNLFDERRTGSIPTTETGKLLHSLGQNPTQEELVKLIKKVPTPAATVHTMLRSAKSGAWCACHRWTATRVGL